MEHMLQSNHHSRDLFFLKFYSTFQFKNTNTRETLLKINVSLASNVCVPFYSTLLNLTACLRFHFFSLAKFCARCVKWLFRVASNY